jgi:hypothetical protein
MDICRCNLVEDFTLVVSAGYNFKCLKIKSEGKTLMAGYSGTPLVKKLGIKSGFNVVFVNAPKGFASGLDLPADVVPNRTSRQPLDFALLFVKSEKDLREKFLHLASRLKPSGMMWVAWPKKSSGVATDLSFTNVQSIGLAAGLVDVKICAVDDIWSGLKFVFRLKDRIRV